MLIPLILSGGSGTRLWPLSRELYPKQLLPLVGKRTMLQDTVARMQGLPDVSAPIVVCNDSHRFMVAEQLREAGIPAQAIILEPVGRNTAPAVAIVALLAVERARASRDGADPDPVLLVLPADHVHARRHGVPARHPGRPCRRGARQARDLRRGPGSRRDRLRLHPPRGRRDGPAYAVQQFVEKPDAATAARYVASGEYYWNSGMFMFRAQALPRGAAAACARDARRLRARDRGREARPRFHAPASRRRSRRARAIRSTTR